MSNVRSGLDESDHGYGAQLFPVGGPWRTVLLGALFLAALLLRLQEIDGVPMDVNPVKQYRSAMVARAMFYRATPEVPQWKIDVAEADVRELGELVPPITEGLAATSYRLIGHEALWIPRMFSVLAWLIGGVFLYFIAVRVGGPDASLISVAYYLLLPAAVVESQSFQPDPVMVGAMLGSLYAILRQHETSSWRWLIVATVLSALAVLIKGIAGFFTIGAFLVLAIARGGPRALVSPAALVFAVGSIAPTALFYARVISTGVLGEHSATGFVPSLMLTPGFYQGWFGMINKTVGLPALIGGLIGLLMLQRGDRRAFVLALWIGYGIYGLVKTYHIHTHPYYQLPFVPILALPMGVALAAITGWLAEHRSTVMYRVATAAVLALAFVLSVGLNLQRLRSGPDFGDEVLVAKAIGEAVDHSTSTILLARYSGRPLRYHGQFSGTYWPDLGEIRSEAVVGLEPIGVEDRLARLVAAYDPEFFVVRDIAEFELQDQLARYLRSTYPLVIDSPQFIIFDLRNRLPADHPVSG